MTDQVAQRPDPRQRPAPPPPTVEGAPAAPAPDQPTNADAPAPLPVTGPPPDDDALARLLASLPGSEPIHVTQLAWGVTPAGLPFDGHPPLDRDGLPPALAHPDDAAPPPPLLALQHAHPQDHEFVPLTVDGVPIAGYGSTGVSGAVPVRVGGHVVTLGAGIGDGVTGKALSGGVTILGINGNDLSLATGSDTLIVVGGSVTVKIGTLLPGLGGVALELLGTGGDDQVTINGSLVSNAVVDLGNGTDTLTLAGNAPIAIVVRNTERIIGNDAGDTITASGTTPVSITGGQGSDVLTGSSGASTLTGGGGSDSLTGGSAADRFDYRAVTDSFSSAAAASDSHTDVIAGFNDAGSVIDFTALAGAGSQSFTGLKTGASFAAAFAGGAGGDVDYAVIGGTTFVHVHQGAGYSAGDLVIALQGTHALTAANLHLQP